MRKVVWSLVLLAIALVACAAQSRPHELTIWERMHAKPLPNRAVAITPIPPFYEQWWHEVEDCVGRKRNFNLVRFYVVLNGKSWFEYEDMPLLGYAFYDGRIALAQNVVTNAVIVRHEMVHLIAPPYMGHDPLYFQIKCAEIVVCSENCLADHGPERP